ncbi:MAG TPA: VWA domain-containing protein [Longimicrobiales bacterium]|nr:VWA domain-containing protein [Longimicrobiales bacterium]
MVEFAWPLVLAAPLVAALALRLVRARERGVEVPGPWPEGFGAAGPSLVDAIPIVLRWGAVAALTLAAAAPVRTVPGPVTGPPGAALMIVLDVSPSMATAIPGAGTKLDAARAEILRFLDGRETDAVGLVTFGLDAVVRVPSSVRREGLRQALVAAAPGDLGDGTALGVALGLASDRLRAVEAPSRVVILVTDGEGNAGALDPVTAARAAGALGHRVHVVDVSGDGASGGLLASVAEAGGGRHHPVADAAGLDRAYREIDALERAPLAGGAGTSKVPAGAPLVWVALALVGLERALRASPWGAIP